MNDGLPKAMLLDLDDTILAFSASTEPCWRSVCEEFAPHVNDLAPTTLYAAIKESRAWFWHSPERHREGRQDLWQARRKIVAAALLQLNIDAPTLANDIADTYSIKREETIHLLPGAIEALRHFRAQGIRLALVTNGSAETQRAKIERFQLAEFFTCILIEGEFGVGKPDERVYRHALHALGVNPAETWMIGDHLEWEVSAPQQLGIAGIWLDLTGQGLPPNSPVRPDRIIRSLAELV